MSDDNKKEIKRMSEDEYEKLSDEKADLKIKLEKAEAQMKLAMIALISLIASYGIMLTPYIPVERVEAIGGISDVYFLGLASIIGAFMGFSAWMSKR